MKTFCITSALIVFVLLSGTYSRMSAQQSYTIKEYLSNAQYYRFANISFFEVNEPATERLIREHLPNFVKQKARTKAFIVTERYKPGTVPNIFGVVLTSPITPTQASDPDNLWTNLCSPMRVFDIQDLKAMPTVSPQGNIRGSLEGTSYTTMDAYLAAEIQQAPFDKRELLQKSYPSLLVGKDYREALGKLRKGAQMPFGYNLEDVHQYESAYNTKRQKNPLAAFTALPIDLLQNATEVKVCDSALTQEIQRDLTKAGYKQLSGDLKLTLLNDECIRLQYGILELTGKALVDAIPNTTGTRSKQSRFSLSLRKEVKIGEAVGAIGIEDVTMIISGTNYCHQITRLSAGDYANSLEFSWDDNDVPSGSYLYFVDPLAPKPFNYNILTKEYTTSDNDTLRRRGSGDHNAYREISGARTGIALMKEYEYRKAHPNEQYKKMPLQPTPTDPQDFQIAIYADIAKEIELPETCSLEQAFSSIDIDYNDPRTSIRVYNGSEPDNTVFWTVSAPTFGNMANQLPYAFRQNKFPPHMIAEKVNPTTNSPFEALTTIQVRGLPQKSPEETRSLRGSVVLAFGYTCSIDGKTEKGVARMTVPINIEYK